MYYNAVRGSPAGGPLFLLLCRLRRIAFVLAPCGKAAADMPLRLVEIQQHTHLPVKPRVNTRQPLSEVFMYGGFRYSEFFGGGTDGRLVFDNIHGQIAGPLL